MPWALSLRFAKRRQQQGCQNGDDRDDHEQLNQREAAKPRTAAIKGSA